MQRKFGKKGDNGSMTQTEDRRFRETFGVGLLVAFTAWNLLEKQDMIPEGGAILHFYGL